VTGDLGPAAAAADRDVVSALRGHALAHAAKCLILLVKIGKKQTRYVLAVVPGDARLDLAAVKALLLVKFFTKRFRGNVCIPLSASSETSATTAATPSSETTSTRSVGQDLPHWIADLAPAGTRDGAGN
jgi:hypothetical protein